MYNINDVGNICFIGLFMFLFIALVGAAEAWPMVGAIGAVILVCAMLRK